MAAPLPTQTEPSDFFLEEQVPLAQLTTFGIGGPARFFASVRTESELQAACAWARAAAMPVFVLGGGSNVLVADAGFPGLIVHIALRGIAEADAGRWRIYSVAGGEDWDKLVALTVQAGCAGIECMAGIPGSVGGTPVQNVGAYGQEVSTVIEDVRCFDREQERFVTFANAECGFRYRQSRFNTSPDSGRYIVTQVRFALCPAAAPTLAYADLKRAFAGHTRAPSLAEVADAVRSIRRLKGMVVEGGALADRDPDTRSAGSFFKNPVVSEQHYQAIAAASAPLTPPSYPAPDSADGAAQRKLPAAWLVEQAGFPRGYVLGGAAISSRHTLALTNRSGSATAADILALRNRIVARVEERFDITLHPEPVLLG